MATKQPTTTVDELLRIPFLRRTNEDKIRIISEGRPTPLFHDVRDSATVYFAMPLSKETQWITGCPKRNRLYCWPCLLFAKKRSLWEHIGVCRDDNLKEKASEHENTVAHMESMITLQVFLDKLKKSKDKVIDVKQEENKNRGIKKRLIDVYCVTVGQQLSNRCLNTNNVLDVEKFTKLMKFLRRYDNIDKNFCDEAMALIETSPEITNRVAHALIKVTKLAIIRDVQSSKYVSLILSQHNDDRSKPQISTILRYLKNGKVYERFIGFTNVPNKLTPDCVLQHIDIVGEEYDISRRIKAISLDGAVLQTEDMITFVDKMKDKISNCCFVPWYSHGVDHILQQCLSSFSTCGQFLKAMASMQMFFQKNSVALLEIIHECNLTLILADSQASLFSEHYNSKFASLQFINAVKMQRQSFVKLFELIIDNCQKWDADSLAKAFGFQKYLQKLQTIFLLEIFSRIFEIVSSFSISLKNDTYDFCKKSVSTLITDFTEMHKDAFSQLNDSIKNEIAEQPSLVKMYDKKINQYISLFNGIMNLIIRDVSCRFIQLDKLEFCNIFEDDLSSAKYLNMWFDSLNKVHLISSNKMSLNYDLLELHKNYDASLKKSVYEFYKLVNESNLWNTFKDLINIAEFILIMPFKPSSVICHMSKLQMIEKWSGDVECTHSYGDVSLLYIESDIFENIKTSPSFHEETMKFFELI